MEAQVVRIFYTDAAEKRNGMVQIYANLVSFYKIVDRFEDLGYRITGILFE